MFQLQILILLGVLGTTTKSVSGADRCLLDQFVVQHANGSTDCQNCPFCLPGQEPSHRCGTNISANDVKNVHCLDCVHGKTFSSSNDTFQCYPCTETNCPDQQVVEHNCSVTADKKCGDVKCGKGMYHETSTGNCQECSWCCGEKAIDLVKKECLDGGMPKERSCSFHHKDRCKPTTVKPTNKPAPWSTAPTCLLDQFVVQHPNGSTDCQNCPFCPRGQEPSHRCGTNISANDVKNVHCLDCVHGKTFSSSNDTFQCYPCTETNCPDQQVVEHDCSVTADKKCGDVKCGKGMYHETTTGNCQECSWCCGEKAIDSVKKECLDGGMPKERSCSFHHKDRCKPTTVKPTNKPAPWSTTPTTAVPTDKQTANTTELVPTLATSSTTTGKSAATKHGTEKTTVAFIAVVIAFVVAVVVVVVVVKVYRRCCSNRSAGQDIDPISGTELGTLAGGNGGNSSARSDSMKHLIPLKDLQAKSPLMPVCTNAAQYSIDEGMTLTEFSNKNYLAFESVCELLDITIKGCGNYEQVAKNYGVTAQTIQSRFEKHGDGPSKALFAWLGGTLPQLTLREFLLVLQNINRQDVVNAFRCV